MKKYLMLLAVLFASKGVFAVSTVQPVVNMATVVVSSVSAAGGAAQVVLSTPTTNSPYSTGYTNYLSHVHIEMYATGTLTGGATPVTCTSTNLPGSLVWKFPTAAATGTLTVQDADYSNPVASTSAATQTLISCPGTASVIWNVTALYMQAP